MHSILVFMLLSCAQDDPPPPALPAEAGALFTDADFGCLHDHEKVGRIWYTNTLGNIDETLSVARAPEGKQFPVGTIAQLHPYEAMVKHPEGFSPQTGDWEFIKLEISGGETHIAERGAAELLNENGTCIGCHQLSEAHDYICAPGHGCAPTELHIQAVTMALGFLDTRCLR